MGGARGRGEGRRYGTRGGKTLEQAEAAVASLKTGIKKALGKRAENTRRRKEEKKGDRIV